MEKIFLFNTLSRQKEEINKEEISLYTCGPTVYDFAHIGNFRTYVFEDLLKRTLLYFGYSVKHVMNITDIDDKTIKGAIKKNISLDAYTEPFKKAFFEDIKTLNILPADSYPEATAYIAKMIEMITELLQKKIAYRGSDGSIYFSISKFKDYGKLSHLKLEDLEKGASQRVNLDEYDKENASDFVLWKAYDEKRDGKIYWDSAFGKGRPGWHIECSAMSIDLLGSSIDIHCGGVDNIFPHHENEIAQSESYTGKKFVNWWLHSEHLVVDNKKMSKSLGNFYTLRDLINRGYSGDQIRYLLIHAHYRMKLNFTFSGLDASKSALNRIEDFINRLKDVDITQDGNIAIPRIEEARKSFKASLKDDLNISAALASFFDFIRDINALIDKHLISITEVRLIFTFLEEIDLVLGFLPLKKEEITIPEDIQEAMQKRELARSEKDYQKADEYRDYILKKGFVLEDTKKGPVVKKR